MIFPLLCYMQCVVLPGMPLDLVVSEVMSTSVRLTWNAPVQKGIPIFSMYTVKLEPNPPFNPMIHTSSSISDLYVPGLVPGISYTATVVASITGSNFSPQEGDVSIPVIFTMQEKGLLCIALATRTFRVCSIVSC